MYSWNTADSRNTHTSGNARCRLPNNYSHNIRLLCDWLVTLLHPQHKTPCHRPVTLTQQLHPQHKTPCHRPVTLTQQLQPQHRLHCHRPVTLTQQLQPQRRLHCHRLATLAQQLQPQRKTPLSSTCYAYPTTTATTQDSYVIDLLHYYSHNTDSVSSTCYTYPTTTATMQDSNVIDLLHYYSHNTDSSVIDLLRLPNNYSHDTRLHCHRLVTLTQQLQPQRKTPMWLICYTTTATTQTPLSSTYYTYPTTTATTQTPLSSTYYTYPTTTATTQTPLSWTCYTYPTTTATTQDSTVIDLLRLPNNYSHNTRLHCHRLVTLTQQLQPQRRLQCHRLITLNQQLQPQRKTPMWSTCYTTTATTQTPLSSTCYTYPTTTATTQDSTVIDLLRLPNNYSHNARLLCDRLVTLTQQLQPQHRLHCHRLVTLTQQLQPQHKTPLSSTCYAYPTTTATTQDSTVIDLLHYYSHNTRLHCHRPVTLTQQLQPQHKTPLSSTCYAYPSTTAMTQDSYVTDLLHYYSHNADSTVIDRLHFTWFDSVVCMTGRAVKMAQKVLSRGTQPNSTQRQVTLKNTS